MLDAEVSPGFRIEQYTAPETIPADFICRVLRIPNDLRIIAAVSDVLAYLSRPFTWETDSEEQEIQMRALMAQMLMTYFDGDCDEPMIGEIRLFVVSILPSNVLPCDGSTYNQGDYPTLAAILPASLKNDVAGTFKTPDFRARVPLGANLDGNAAPGDYSIRNIGDTGGVEAVALTVDQIPEHHHRVPSIDSGGAGSGYGIDVASSSEALSADIFSEAVGGGETHTNMPPFFVVKFGIVAR